MTFRDDFLLKTSLSAVGHDVWPAQAETAVGKQCLFISNPHLLRTHQVYVVITDISDPTNAWPLNVWTNAMGPMAFLRLGLCHLIDWTSQAVVVLWLMYPHRRELGTMSFRNNLLGGLHIHSRSCSNSSSTNGSSSSWAAFLRKMCLLGYTLGFYFLSFLSSSCLP